MGVTRMRGWAPVVAPLVLLVALVVLLASACGTGTTAGTTATVSITGNRFDPATLTISAGTTVVWKNDSQTPHTVVSDRFGQTPPAAAGHNEMASGVLQPGETYKTTFTYTGAYRYHSTIHPSMRGVVIVR